MMPDSFLVHRNVLPVCRLVQVEKRYVRSYAQHAGSSGTMGKVVGIILGDTRGTSNMCGSI